MNSASHLPSCVHKSELVRSGSVNCRDEQVFLNMNTALHDLTTHLMKILCDRSKCHHFRLSLLNPIIWQIMDIRGRWRNLISFLVYLYLFAPLVCKSTLSQVTWLHMGFPSDILDPKFVRCRISVTGPSTSNLNINSVQEDRTKQIMACK
jgi:hypothetical protein